jgi:hypothetical protein
VPAHHADRVSTRRTPANPPGWRPESPVYVQVPNTHFVPFYRVPRSAETYAANAPLADSGPGDVLVHEGPGMARWARDRSWSEWKAGSI